MVGVGQRGPAPKAASTSLILSSHTFSRKMWLERKLMMSVKKTNVLRDEDLVETAKELTARASQRTWWT